MRRGFASGAHAYANSRRPFSLARLSRTRGSEPRGSPMRTCHPRLDGRGMQFRESSAILATERQKDRITPAIAVRSQETNGSTIEDTLVINDNTVNINGEERCDEHGLMLAMSARTDSDETENVDASAKSFLAIEPFESPLRSLRAIDPTANSRLIS